MVMSDEDIRKKLIIALGKLMSSKDIFLLEKNISERAISHRLAIYIENEFITGKLKEKEYDVDCEYNGYVEADKNRKHIMILRNKADELGITRKDEIDKEKIYRGVYPDSIIHKRGSNAEGSNLLIIEIKKSNSPEKEKAFDEEKLFRYTSKEPDNYLNYKLGASILLTVKPDKPTYSIDWYADGCKID